MAKQKIVVKLAVKEEKKIRKAIKMLLVSPVWRRCSLSLAVSLVGSNKDQIALMGEGIDSVGFAKLLRKGVGYAELVSVGSVEDKKPAAPAIQTQGMAPQLVYPHHYNFRVRYNACEVPYNNDPSCTIM